MLLTVFKKVSISLTIPVRVNVLVPEAPITTPPASAAAMVPPVAVNVSGISPAESVSPSVKPDKSKLLAMSSITVISAGKVPVSVGTALAAGVGVIDIDFNPTALLFVQPATEIVTLEIPVVFVPTVITLSPLVEGEATVSITAPVLLVTTILVQV